MNLDGLRCLVRVVKYGSVSRAARELGISRATVRRRLQELEEAVGATLLVRGEAGSVPTPAALEVARRGQVILAEVEEILSISPAANAEPRGVLRMLIPTGMHPATVHMTFGTFRAAAPGFRLELFADDDPSARLDEAFDVVLCLNRRRPTSSFWEIVDLPPVREGLFTTVTYLDRHGPLHEVEDLARHDLIVWRSPDGDPLLLPSTEGDVPVQPLLVSTNLHHVHCLVHVGAGIGYGVWGMAFEEPEHPLVGVLETVGRERPLRLFVRPSLLQSTKLAALVDAVRATSERSQPQ